LKIKIFYNKDRENKIMSLRTRRRRYNTDPGPGDNNKDVTEKFKIKFAEELDYKMEI
jgi:hypothetical protein